MTPLPMLHPGPPVFAVRQKFFDYCTPDRPAGMNGPIRPMGTREYQCCRCGGKASWFNNYDHDAYAECETCEGLYTYHRFVRTTATV